MLRHQDAALGQGVGQRQQDAAAAQMGADLGAELLHRARMAAVLERIFIAERRTTLPYSGWDGGL